MTTTTLERSVSPRRKLLAPEVIQLSTMDCGPAALKSMLEGFGIRVNYGRLRDACSTDVDGTSIDVLEDVAVELGLDAEQVMVPADHLLAPESNVLPAILIVKQRAVPVHFIVLWRLSGGLAQIMDPAGGRRWVTEESLLRDLYVHPMRVSAEDWREWAGSDTFGAPLVGRIRRLGVGARSAEALLDDATKDPSWRSLGALDAATRLLERLTTSGGLDAGERNAAILRRLMGMGVETDAIPDLYWTVRPAPAGEDGAERITFRGAVLVRVQGRATGEKRATTAAETIDPEVLAALRRPAATAWGPFLTALREARVSIAGIIAAALVVSAAGVLVQALLVRGLLDIGDWFDSGGQRLGAALAVGVFLVGAMLLNIPTSLAIAGLGRRLEARLRIAFARKIPRVADHYFHSRLLSDMAERMHSIAVVRGLPGLVAGWLSTAFSLAFTTIALLWLAPWLKVWVVVTVGCATLFSLVAPVIVQEREMRLRSHGSTLMRFYLDALLGLSPVRAHSAGPAMLREQEAQLVHWADSGLRLQTAYVWIDAVQMIVGAALAISVVMMHVAREGTSASILLVAYWGLQLPTLAQAMAGSARQVAPVRNMLVRLLEILDAPEETRREVDRAVPGKAPAQPSSSPIPEGPDAGAELAIRTDATAIARPKRSPREGVRLQMRGVTVRVGGHTVLDGVDLDIAPGTQVAIVGESGAGKSTLVGLLLGWNRAGAGSIALDGAELTSENLALWRRRTAWIDPSVQLYNRRFVQNLIYGSEDAVGDMGTAIDQADLRDVLERLPEGLQTSMGEGGALVSGGEGQRVRLGRAWLRRDARLVLFDEPFRGLDRAKRKLLLDRARRAWTGSTMLCVTHDVSHTLDFKRVLVIEGGRVVEDGDPRALACDLGSRYHQMLASEQFVLESLWANEAWRRFRVENGTITEQGKKDWIDVAALVEGADAPDLAPRLEGARGELADE